MVHVTNQTDGHCVVQRRQNNVSKSWIDPEAATAVKAIIKVEA